MAYKLSVEKKQPFEEGCTLRMERMSNEKYAIKMQFCFLSFLHCYNILYNLSNFPMKLYIIILSRALHYLINSKIVRTKVFEFIYCLVPCSYLYSHLLLPHFQTNRRLLT